MIRKLVLLAITSGLIKKAFDAYKDVQQHQRQAGTGPASSAATVPPSHPV